MKRSVYEISESAGCRECPFNTSRCDYLMGNPVTPSEGIIDGCPLGDGETITLRLGKWTGQVSHG